MSDSSYNFFHTLSLLLAKRTLAVKCLEIGAHPMVSSDYDPFHSIDTTEVTLGANSCSLGKRTEQVTRPHFRKTSQPWSKAPTNRVILKEY